MLLSIYKLEDELETSEPLCKLKCGEHTLGRGPTLQCTDKRVSRNHIQIVLSENATITAKHEINPCFYRASGSKHISLLKFNIPVELSSGDAFGFFPDQSWFKIVISKLTEANQQDVNANVSKKRSHDEADDEGNHKLPKLSHDIDEMVSTSGNNEDVSGNENVNHVENDNNSNNEPELNDLINPSSTVNDNASLRNNTNTTVINNNPENDDNKTDESVKVKEEAVSDDEAASANNVTVKKEFLSDDEDADQATCSKMKKDDKTLTRRDRCWYGSNCYQKNHPHKTKFSHPGDHDYDTDVDDVRPQCQYGGTCYRRNTGHRRDFKHSRFAKRPNPPTNPANMNPVATANPVISGDSQASSQASDDARVTKKNILKTKRPRKKKNMAESPPDDYDFDDPFLDNNGSDDEFEFQSESEESELSDDD